MEKLESVKRRFHSEQCKANLVVTEADIEPICILPDEIPVQKLAETESARLVPKSRRCIKEEIGNGGEAVECGCKSGETWACRTKRSRRPIGSFLFLGPRAWKTELSKALAALFGDENE